MIAAERLDRDTQSRTWLIDSANGMATRLTSHPALEGFPVWSPDGRQVIYGRSGSDDGRALYQKSADGSGSEDVFVTIDVRPLLIRQTTQLSSDGRFLVYGGLDPKTQWDLWVRPLSKKASGQETKEYPYLRTEFNEHHGQLSSDGRWMAYSSDESGRWEVYVGAFPAADARSRISPDGGTEPRWRRDGRELFYLAADGTIMSVAVEPGTRFVASAPRALFKISVTPTTNPGWNPHYVPPPTARFLTTHE